MEIVQCTISKTATAVHLLISGCGLLLSLLFFILFESSFGNVGICNVLKFIRYIKCIGRLFQMKDVIWNDVVAIKVKPVEKILNRFFISFRQNNYHYVFLSQRMFKSLGYGTTCIL